MIRNKKYFALDLGTTKFCIASFSNPETNINFAVGLSKDSCGEIGTDWHDWSTASADNCDISQGGNCRR